MIRFRTERLNLTKKPDRHYFSGNWWHLRSVEGGTHIVARFGPDSAPADCFEDTLLTLPMGRPIGWVWLSIPDNDALADRDVILHAGEGFYGALGAAGAMMQGAPAGGGEGAGGPELLTMTASAADGDGNAVGPVTQFYSYTGDFIVNALTVPGGLRIQFTLPEGRRLVAVLRAGTGNDVTRRFVAGDGGAYLYDADLRARSSSAYLIRTAPA